MSRTEIVNKTKSQWFGYKYRVTPELSEALQKTVFAEGGKGWPEGRWVIKCTDKPFIVVSLSGSLTHSRSCEYFEKHEVVEKKIKLVNGVLVEDKDENKGFTISPKGVKIDNSTGAPEGYEWERKCFFSNKDWSKLENITPNDMFGCALIVNNKEENTMTNKTNRRAVIVRVWDNDVSLPVEDALVMKSEEIITEDNDQAVIQEFLAQGDIKGAIMEHNKVRENTVNVEILNRVGNKVMLQPIRKISELTIEVVKV